MASIVSLHPNSPSSSPSLLLEHSGVSRRHCQQIPQSSCPHPSSYSSSIFVIFYSFVITLVVDHLPPPQQPMVFIIVSICRSCSHLTLVSPTLNHIIIVNVFVLLLLTLPERGALSSCPCRCAKSLHPDHLLVMIILNFAVVLSGLVRISALVLAFLPPPPSVGSNIPDLPSPPPLSKLPPHFLYHLLLLFPLLFLLEFMALNSLSFLFIVSQKQ